MTFFDNLFSFYMVFVLILLVILSIGLVYVGYKAIEHWEYKDTIPNIILEDTRDCQINCSQCLAYCNTIIDETLQTYIKMRNVGTTVAIREGIQ